MDINMQQEISNKIDKLSYDLYKIEIKIRKIEDNAKNKWDMIYEPMLHSIIDDNFIRFKTFDEYYIYTINKNKYKRMMNNKTIVETELHFYYSLVKEYEI